MQVAVTERVADRRRGGVGVGVGVAANAGRGTARDLLAHVAGIATEISEGNPPSGDSQAWVDKIVDDRRSKSVGELIDEWQRSGPAFEMMAATTKRLSVPLSYDTVVHEHDLRGQLVMIFIDVVFLFFVLDDGF